MDIVSRVFIIILNWNGGADTLECLGSVEKIDYPNFQIVVVDNGSTDGSQEAIKSDFPHITLLENGRNLGFAEGNNVGICFALNRGAHYVLLLNNDTRIDSSALDAMVQMAQSDPQIGIIGPKIHYWDQPGKLWFAGGTYNLGSTFEVKHLGHGENDQGQYDVVRDVDYITGCALLAKVEMIRKVGFLEPHYFLLYEEADWCSAARRLGYRCVYCPQAKVWHKVSASLERHSPRFLYYNYRNALLFIKRNATEGRSHAYHACLRDAARVTKDLLLGSWRHPGGILRAAAITAGIFDFLRKRFGQGPRWIDWTSVTIANIKRRRQVSMRQTPV